MRDIINATIGENHFLKCPMYIIARNGEGLTPCLSISIPDGLCDYWAYIDFKKPNGETFKTPRIDVNEGKITYNIPSAVLDADGKLEVQVVFQNEDGDIWKSYVKEFAVRYSINATDDIPDKQDFITEAQKLLDEMAKNIENGSNKSTLFVGTEITYIGAPNHKGVRTFGTTSQLMEAKEGDFYLNTDEFAVYLICSVDFVEVIYPPSSEPTINGVRIGYCPFIPPADETYNPESQNAQSGKAVAKAVEPKLSKEIVDTLPDFAEAKENVIYVVKNANGTYEEYHLIPNHKTVLNTFAGVSVTTISPSGTTDVEKGTIVYPLVSYVGTTQYIFTVGDTQKSFITADTNFYNAVAERENSLETYYDVHIELPNADNQAYGTAYITQYTYAPHWEVIGGSSKYELIETVTLTEETNAITRNTEFNGKPYNFKAVYVELFLPKEDIARTLGTVSVYFPPSETTATLGQALYSSGHTTVAMWNWVVIAEIDLSKGLGISKGFCGVRRASPLTTMSMIPYSLYSCDDTIKQVAFASTNALPVGTTFKIYGVRA